MHLYQIDPQCGSRSQAALEGSLSDSTVLKVVPRTSNTVFVLLLLCSNIFRNGWGGKLP